ncbi:phosphoglycerate kinase [Tistrella mobilis]|uniref:Phosphoglycerate kinase n=1 Tax=Tistrella mobilis (strain KA081020-065) TaxID=1110502 RepID=I3TIY4_TISMK|nr:phosphoglycerate kinase [Tistrella mobilis]AFK52722.1 phosphoglycerate kinase [Tistrella mobilis KA081020-065]
MPASFKTLDQIDVAGKVVLVRLDLNVPMKDGVVTDATRIERQAPTVRALAERGARVVVLSHFDRPKGKVVPSMSLKPVAAPLAAAIGRPVAFAEDCIGDTAAAVVGRLGDGEVALLENLRFHAGEEKNEAGFADALASLGQVFISDAFSCAHRAHASTVGLAERLPTAAGLSMQAELEALGAALAEPQRPVAAIVGGAKVSTKIDLLNNLVARVDAVIIGGGMANTFLHAQGIAVGKSLCEADLAETARGILAKAEAAGCKVVLPVDAVVAREFKAGADNRTVDVAEVAADEMILDVGPKTVAEIEACLAGSKTLLWNGPFGAFEIQPFDAATVAVAKAVEKLTSGGTLASIAGGGDTVAALAHAGVVDALTYVSTAGGAFLEYCEGKELPGVAALSR